jgi:hypothetical protein
MPEMKTLVALITLTLAAVNIPASKSNQPSIDLECSVFDSTLFQYVAQHAAHPSWYIDSETNDEVVFAVGNDLSWRFDRWYTVKVSKKSGKVYQLKSNVNGEEVWELDAPARAATHETSS